MRKMVGLPLPREPVFVFFGEGDRVDEVARHAEVVRQQFGPGEASGLLEAHYVPEASVTVVFVAARCEEFGHYMKTRQEWRHVRSRS
jgi:hypothetical protein